MAEIKNYQERFNALKLLYPVPASGEAINSVGEKFIDAINGKYFCAALYISHFYDEEKYKAGDFLSWKEEPPIDSMLAFNFAKAYCASILENGFYLIQDSHHNPASRIADCVNWLGRNKFVLTDGDITVPPLIYQVDDGYEPSNEDWEKYAKDLLAVVIDSVGEDIPDGVCIKVLQGVTPVTVEFGNWLDKNPFISRKCVSKIARTLYKGKYAYEVHGLGNEISILFKGKIEKDN